MPISISTQTESTAATSGELPPPSDARLVAEPPLVDFTEEVRKARMASWYRSPIPSTELKRLHVRSDLQAAWQTLGHLGLLIVLGGGAIWGYGHLPWWATLALVCANGVCASFAVNAIHELGHGTVFKTKRWNTVFCHIFAFLGGINHEMFQASHVRHHRYTLHPPDDLEVRLPIRLAIVDFFKNAVFNIDGFKWAYGNVLRIARGRFEGEWELTLFPPGQPEKRRPAVRWARILIGGHLAILTLGIALGNPIIPLVVTFGAMTCGGLFWLCNNTQHVGLQDNVNDFRLCCRTFTLNPVLGFLYWQMNFHTEHHMYAAVPCYHLGRLHALIRDDLPQTPNGLFAVWREIGGILLRQARDPSYVHTPTVPNVSTRQRPESIECEIA